MKNSLTNSFDRPSVDQTPNRRVNPATFSKLNTLVKGLVLSCIVGCQSPSTAKKTPASNPQNTPATPVITAQNVSQYQIPPHQQTPGIKPGTPQVVAIGPRTFIAGAERGVHPGYFNFQFFSEMTKSAGWSKNLQIFMLKRLCEYFDNEPGPKDHAREQIEGIMYLIEQIETS